MNNPDATCCSQQVRLCHQGANFQWLAGLFYESFHDRGDVRTRLDSFATFGELTCQLSEQGSFTGRARWFTRERDRSYFTAHPVGNILFQEDPNRSTSGAALKGNIRCQFDDSLRLYARYSEGIRNGGGNIVQAGSVLPAECDPDFLQNYGTGFKSRWFDNRLQFNRMLSPMAWEDCQTEVPDPGPNFATMVSNAGNAPIDGAELEVTVNRSREYGIRVLSRWGD